MQRSIDLRKDGLKDGRYIRVVADDQSVKVSAVWIQGFRQEGYEDNGALWNGYLIAPLDEDMKGPAAEPEQEVILLGQRIANEPKTRFFPFDPETYVWMCGFEESGSKSFFDWNGEECPRSNKEQPAPRLARGVSTLTPI